MYNYTEPKKEIVKPSEITEEQKNGVKKKKKFRQFSFIFTVAVLLAATTGKVAKEQFSYQCY